jgi:hypothetical protein
MKNSGWIGIRLAAVIVVLLFAVGGASAIGWDTSAALQTLPGLEGCAVDSIAACMTPSDAAMYMRCTAPGGGSEEFAGDEGPQCLTCLLRPNHICAGCDVDLLDYFPDPDSPGSLSCSGGGDPDPD